MLWTLTKLMECGTWSVVGHLEDGTTVVHPLACRRWGCRSCAPRKKRQLLDRLNGTKPVSLMTLTSRPSAHESPNSAFFRMSLAINRLFKRMRRTWPHAEIEYFMVWERTKAGWPHAHLLLRAPFIPQPWLSRQWNELTGAPIVDIRRVHTAGQVVSYISKYLAKDPQAPNGMKRYRSSLRFFPKVMPTNDPLNGRIVHWSLSKRSPREIAIDFLESGYSIHQSVDGSWTAWPRGHPNAPLLPDLSIYQQFSILPA